MPKVALTLSVSPVGEVLKHLLKAGIHLTIREPYCTARQPLLQYGLGLRVQQN